MTIIAHLDMDAFFAAVEERDKPWLLGLPISVGADPKGGLGRGVVATANYTARKYGLHSALPITKAWRYSEVARKRGEPGVVFLSPTFKKYKAVSEEVMEIVGHYSPRVQVTSIDEAYVDLSHTSSFEEAKKLCKKLKQDIVKETKLACSVGIGPNKMIAKIASDFEKPDGLTVVTPEEVRAFLAPLSVRVIPGVGPKAEQKLLLLGARTIEELRKLSEEDLVMTFGKLGGGMYGKARGEGSTELISRAKNKSIGEHRTFEEDTLDLNFVMSCLGEMAQDVHGHFVKKEYKSFRTIVATVRFADFETKTRSLTSTDPLFSKEVLESRGLKLLLPFFDKSENPQKKLIRMIGLRIEKLL